MKKGEIKIEEGETFSGIDTTGFTSAFAKKVEGKKVLVKRIYKRMGASDRSFVCVFLAKTKRQKDFEHTFNEFEKLTTLLIP